MKYSRILNIIALCLIAFGLVVIGSGAFIRNRNAALVASPIASSTSNTPPSLPPSAIQDKPVELAIPSLNIRNQVIDGVFNDQSGKWTLTTDKAQFATMTTEPNDTQGMTFIYGHNRKEVFNRLPKIIPGAEVTIMTANNLIFTYRYTSSVTVDPSDASVFDYSGPPVLVLQTCTGMFFQNRQLFTFEFVGVRNV